MTPGITQLLFWLFAVIVLQPFSLRLSLVAFLVIVNFDMSAVPGHTADVIGWENTLKALFMPAVLLLRVVFDARRKGRWGAVVRLSNSVYVAIWLAFCAYVLVSVLWSPFKVPGLKLVAALSSHALIFFLFATAWISGRLKPQMLITALVLSAVLALFQSYVLGNYHGGYHGGGRLTSFVQAQTFGQYIVLLASIGLWAWTPRSTPMLKRGLLLAAIGTLLLFNGSRSAGVGAIAMVMVWVLWMHGRQRLQALTVATLGVIVLAAGIGFFGVSENNRFVELTAALGGDTQRIVEDVGTFRWRSAIYRETWDQLRNFDITDRLFGRGASSGALVGVDLAQHFHGPQYRRFISDTLPPNAVIHNEFLRTYYEFGVLWGTAFVLAVLIAIALAIRLSFFVSYSQRARIGPWAGPLVSTLPLLLLILAVENIFYASAHPGIAAALLILARYASYPYQYDETIRSVRPATASLNV